MTKSNIRLFARDVLTILTGTVAAQALAIMVLPALTRAYPVTEFGYFGAFSAAVGLMAIFANLRLDLAVITAMNEERAARMVVLSVLCACVLTIVTSAFVVLGIFSWSMYRHEPPMIWIASIPIAAASVSIFNTFCAWHSRKTRFRMIASMRFLQVILMISLQAAFVWLMPIRSGLIIGSMLASVATTSIWCIRTLRLDGHRKINANWRNALHEVLSMKSFSSKAITIDGLSQSLSQLPIFFLGYQFSVKEMGYFVLTQRILLTPSNLLGGAISEVFRQRATKTYTQDGNCRHLFQQTMKLLLSAVILFGIPLILFLPDLVAFIFGEPWRESGYFAQILLPAFALKFLAHPLSYLILLRNRLSFEIILHIIMLIALVIGMSVCVYLEVSIKGMLIYYSIVYMVAYLAYLVYSYRLSLGEAVYVQHDIA